MHPLGLHASKHILEVEFGVHGEHVTNPLRGDRLGDPLLTEPQEVLDVYVPDELAIRVGDRIAREAVPCDRGLDVFGG